MTVNILDPEASDRALRFLGSLAPDAPDDLRTQAWLDLEEVMCGPVEMNTMLTVLVGVAGGMWEAATGEKPGIWTFRIETPFGAVPVDSAPPDLRWTGRWFAAALNCDAGATADLWFGTPTTHDEAKQVTKVFVPSILTFLRSAVAAFLAAGKPFPENFGDRFKESA